MFTLGNSGRVLEWIGDNPGDPDGCEKLLLWIELVCRNPAAWTTGTVTNTTNGRQFHYSDVPGAEVRVTFKLFETPVRALYILDISRGLYKSS